jgi:hypothetical protein
VEAGGHTTFTPGVPFLGLNSTVGMAYAPAGNIQGVNYAAPTLAAVLFLGDEVHAVPMIGNYRILSLLGGHCRYYPTPPWSDRDRPPMLSRAQLEQSLLTRTTTTFLPGATVRAQVRLGDGPAGRASVGQDLRTWGDILSGPVTLRTEEQSHGALRRVLDQLPADAPLTILTTPAPQANVRLIWRPGQNLLQTIYRFGHDLSWVTGGFVLFLAAESLDEGARVFEDGFALQLHPGTWVALREALGKGRPWSLPAAGGLQGFTLEWDWPSRVKMVSGLFYQPDEVLRQRLVNQQEFLHFIGEVDRVVRGYFSELEPGPGQALTLVLAIRPGRRARFWLEFNPGGLPDEVPAGLQRRLQELRPPEARHGPVAHANHVLLWGGTGEGEAGSRSCRASGRRPGRQAARGWSLTHR